MEIGPAELGLTASDLRDRERERDPERIKRIDHDHDNETPPAASFNRRSFFHVMGLSTAAVAAASCKRAPVAKIVPYMVKPEEVTPGEALWYASTCEACSARCGILLKTREGRPIKVEGNEKHPASKGGVCALGQASVLSLYDAARARGPLAAGKPTTWAALDEAVKAALAKASAGGKAIRVVTPAVVGPTAEAAIAAFLAAFPTAKRVTFDALPYDEAIADAHATTHGARVVPAYNFAEAKVVVSVGADFLGTWVSPVAFTRDYAKAREPEGARPMLRHIQLEATMSLTGSNADRRYVIAPSDEIPVLAAIARRVLEGSDAAGKDALLAAVAKVAKPELDARSIDAVVKQLLANRAAALVLSGSTDPRAQALVNVINHALGSAVAPVDRPLHRLAAAVPFSEFLAELKSGGVGAVVLCGGGGLNPVYAHPDGAEIAKALGAGAFVVATNDRLDETASVASHLAPTHHFLESWGDAEAGRPSALSLLQPAVSPLFDTRGSWESLLAWAGKPAAYYDFLRARWEKEVFSVAKNAGASFQAFWDRSVHDGVVALSAAPEAAAPFRVDEAAKAVASLPAVVRGGLEVALYAKVGMRDGAMANNGWLQELPDPISKVTWGNYVAVSPALAKRNGFEESRVVTVSAGGRKVSLPVLIQQGMHDNVVAIAVGYGRAKAGKVANGVGANAFALARIDAGRVTFSRVGASIGAAGAVDPLAFSQTHHSQERRGIAREATAEAFYKDAKAGNHQHRPPRLTMWKDHTYTGNRWGMAIDLSKCTGCSACVVACNAENNITTVGKDEVRRRREMHWLRIDRYYEGPPENPAVVYQPMTCLHCENAPCETVCPVLATVHSSEGLNQQVYNRCVGTRYCANNCPPKVRRFNWFEYDHGEPIERLVLNPDVVVRSRGVMEKCSLCVQRIQAGKADAKREGRPVADGDIRTACQQSCPADAIVFGDLNDPKSRLAALVKSGRNYRLFDDLNVGPVVSYLTKIRNFASDLRESQWLERASEMGSPTDTEGDPTLSLAQRKGFKRR